MTIPSGVSLVHIQENFLKGIIQPLLAAILGKPARKMSSKPKRTQTEQPQEPKHDD
jgi:hypothetical protein